MKLSVILEAIDRVTKPVRAITSTVRRLNTELGLARLAGSVGRVGTAFGKVAKEARETALKVTAAVTLIAGGLLGLVKRSADAGDAAAKAAQRIGIGVESYQRLGHAANLAGSSNEELGLGLTLFNRQITAAARGNKAASSEFRRLGISIKDANGKVKPTEQLFGEIAERLSKMPDGARKTAIAMTFFGRSGANLIPTLNLGAAGLRQAADEAEHLGVVIGGAASKQSEDFNDNLSRLQSSVFGVFNTIASSLIPILNPLIVNMTEWVVANRALIGTRVQAFLAALPAVISSIRDAAKLLLAVLRPIVSLFRLVASVIGPTNAAMLIFGGIVAGKLVISVAQLGFELGGLAKAFTLTSLSVGKLVFGPVIAAVWNFVTAIRAGYGGMAAFNLVLSANPIGAVIIAVTALAAAAFLIYRNWGAIAPWFGQLFAALEKIFGGFVDFIAGIFTLDFGRAWDGVATIFQGFVDWFNTLFGGVIGTINAFGSGVKRVASLVGLSSGTGAASTAATGGSPARAADVPVAARTQVGGELHVRIDSEGTPRVVSAQSNNPRVPLTVDAGRVMP